MLIYMESKNVKMEDPEPEKKKKKRDDDSDSEEYVPKAPPNPEDLMSLEQILDLPHVEKHIQNLQDRVSMSKTINSHRLPELGRTTNLTIKMEDSQLAPDGEIKNPMTMTFNKRSRSVAEQNPMSQEMSTAKNSNTMGSRPYLGSLSKKQSHLMRRDSSLDGNFFFTAAGTKSQLGRDTSQRTLPDLSQKTGQGLKDRFDNAPRLAAQHGHQRSQAQLHQQLDQKSGGIEDDDAMFGERPSQQHVTLSFGDMTIDPTATHISMLGSTVVRKKAKRSRNEGVKTHHATATKSKKSKSPLLETQKLRESNGLANVKETFRNLSRIGQLPIQIDDLKVPSTTRKKKKTTNLQMKNFTDDFLTRTAEQIENVETKTRNVYKSPRTDFSHYVHGRLPDYNNVKSKLGIRQQSVKLTEAQA